MNAESISTPDPGPEGTVTTPFSLVNVEVVHVGTTQEHMCGITSVHRYMCIATHPTTVKRTGMCGPPKHQLYMLLSSYVRYRLIQAELSRGAM